ncbi:MAG: hypothetical protein ACYS8Z_02265 [Planctomycetota bacterium]
MDPNSMSSADVSFFEQYKDLILVLLGAFCATVGGIFTAWYRARKAREIKLKEAIGAKQAHFYEEAFVHINELIGILHGRSSKEAAEFLDDKSEWFVRSVMYLPSAFTDNWKSISASLGELHLSKEVLRETAGQDRRKYGENIVALNKHMDKLAQDALKALLKDCDMKPLNIRWLHGRPKLP